MGEDTQTAERPARVEANTTRNPAAPNATPSAGDQRRDATRAIDGQLIEPGYGHGV
jgi:hypothetical protein